MGLFDKILKGAVDAIDNAAAKSGNGPTGLKDLFNQAMDKKNEAINGTSSSTASSKPSTATSSTSSSKRSNCAYTRPTYTTLHRKCLPRETFLQSLQEKWILRYMTARMAR